VAEGKVKLKIWDWVLVVVLALLAGLIRWYPESKVGFFPIGYDTFNAYVPDLTKSDGNLIRWFFSSDLLYLILWPIKQLFHLDANTLIKFTGPVLYGLLTSSFYLLCRKFLNWKILPSLLAGLFLMVQLATLRMSWDLFRNMLSLIFLFAATYCLYANHKVKNLVLLGIFSVLIVMSNPLVAGLWFILLLVWLAVKLVKKEYQNCLMILSAILPALVFFVLCLKTSQTNNFGGRVFYEAESDRIFTYFTAYVNKTTYSNLVQTITSLFWLMFKFVWPLAIYGFYLMRKNILLTALTIWLLIGSFSSIVFGGYGVFVWDRWMMMLVFPLIIYMVYGGWALGEKISKIKIFKPKWMQIVLTSFAVIFWLAYLSLFVYPSWAFVDTPVKKAKMPFANKLTNQYFPVSMLNNSVGFENIADVLKCIEYINSQAPDQSIVAVDNRYRGIVITNLDFSKGYVYSFPWSSKVNQDTLLRLRSQDIGPVYTIWSPDFTVKSFRRVFRSGDMVVWRDQKTFENFQGSN